MCLWGCLWFKRPLGLLPDLGLRGLVGCGFRSAGKKQPLHCAQTQPADMVDDSSMMTHHHGCMHTLVCTRWVSALIFFEFQQPSSSADWVFREPDPMLLWYVLYVFSSVLLSEASALQPHFSRSPSRPLSSMLWSLCHEPSGMCVPYVPRRQLLSGKTAAVGVEKSTMHQLAWSLLCGVV